MRRRVGTAWTVGLLGLAMLAGAGDRPVRADEGPRPTPQPGVVRTGRVVLRAHEAKVETFEAASVHLRMGVRDDPGQLKTLGAWDLVFRTGDRLVVGPSTRVARQVIVDLGEHAWDALPEVPALPECVPGLTTAAPARIGHVYAVRIEAPGRDDLALVRVEALDSGVSCEIAYVLLAHDLPGEIPALDLDAAVREEVVSYLRSALAGRARTRDDPRLLPERGPYRLQLLTGDQKGQVSRVALRGWGSTGVDRWSPKPLTVEGEASEGALSVAHATPGTIPPDRVLLVERIDVRLAAAGDANGKGVAAIWLPDRELIRRERSPQVVSCSFRGREIIDPRRGTIFALAGSTSSVQAVIHGRLLTPEEAGAIEPEPLTVGGEARVPPAGEGPWLEDPRVVLEMAYAGHGDGRSRELSLVTRGRIPPGHYLLIREIHYEGRAPFELRLPTTVLRKRFGGPEGERWTGVWYGRQLVPSGRESDVVLRVWPGGRVRFVLTGELRRWPKPAIGPFRK